VGVDPRYYRAAGVETLFGDRSKAKVRFGWVPKVVFPELMREMVAADCVSAERDHLVKQAGYPTYDYHE
jgi:GDPmannose 4,6-dehydratase